MSHRFRWPGTNRAQLVIAIMSNVVEVRWHAINKVTKPNPPDPVVSASIANTSSCEANVTILATTTH